MVEWGTRGYGSPEGWEATMDEFDLDTLALRATDAEDRAAFDADWRDVEAGERFNRETDAINAANPQWFDDYTDVELHAPCHIVVIYGDERWCNAHDSAAPCPVGGAR